MSMFLTLAFLFAIGSVAGWVLEVFFDVFTRREIQRENGSILASALVRISQSMAVVCVPFI